MDDVGLFGSLAFATFVFVGAVTFLVVTSVQKVRTDLERFNSGERP